MPNRVGGLCEGAIASPEEHIRGAGGLRAPRQHDVELAVPIRVTERGPCQGFRYYLRVEAIDRTRATPIRKSAGFRRWNSLEYQGWLECTIAAAAIDSRHPG